MSKEPTDAERSIRHKIRAQLGPPPERWKRLEDWTPADHEAAKYRGERPESEEWIEYQRSIRRAAGAIGQLGGTGRSCPPRRG